MKKLFRTLLCGAVLTLSLSVSAFAAESDLLISPAPSFLLCWALQVTPVAAS